MAVVVAIGFLYTSQQGGSTPADPKPLPSAANTQPKFHPEPPKPKDEAKEAADSFEKFASDYVESTSKIFVGKTVYMRLSTGAVFEYKIDSLKLKDTDVRKSDSLTTPTVGTIQMEEVFKLENVTDYPRKFVPYSAEAPRRLVSVECVRRGNSVGGEVTRG